MNKILEGLMAEYAENEAARKIITTQYNSLCKRSKQLEQAIQAQGGEIARDNLTEKIREVLASKLKRKRFTVRELSTLLTEEGEPSFETCRAVTGALSNLRRGKEVEAVGKKNVEYSLAPVALYKALKQ